MSVWAECWKRAESQRQYPRRLRSVVLMPWDEFVGKALSHSYDFAEYVVSALHGGDVLVLRGAFTHGFMRDLKRKTVAWIRGRAPSFHKMLEGSPDFHRIIDLETGRRYAFSGCKHSAYFYRWNEDPLGIWHEITERWRVVKQVMGLRADEYESFTPKDGVVDRIQVVRYPPSIGYLEPHTDPFLHQRLFLSAYMGKRGVDYQGGGFYAVDDKDRAVEIEDSIEVGDIAIGCATVCHGVAPCDRGRPADWDADDGRWFLSLYSNASDEVPQRHTGAPEKVHVEGVLP